MIEGVAMQHHNYMEAAEYIKSQREHIAERIMQEGGIYLYQDYTGYQIDKCRQDTLYNLQYLAESLMIESTGLWENYIIWLRILLSSLGLGMQGLSEHFRVMGDVLIPLLDHPAAEFVKRLTGSAAKLVLDDAPDLSFTQESTGEYAERSRQYQELLLSAQKRKALKYIDQLIDDGIPFRNIYLDIIQPVQREIGNLWHRNKISVAQEHYCTGVSQLVIAHMYPRMFNASPSKYKVVSTCVHGELHELGLRMVTDIMELDGWDTYYLGANMPNDSILSMLKAQKADLLAISVTFPLNLHKAEELVSLVRQDKDLQPLKIMVGGYAFMQDTALWQKIRADSFAPNADIASKVASSLLEGIK